MAIEATDLQPKRFKVTVKGNGYWCNPPRMGHRIILMKVRPLFTAIADLAEGKDTSVSSDKILEYQRDLDALFADLIPELQDVTLDEGDLVGVIDQLVTNSMPQEARELEEAKVKMGGDEEADPKAETTG